MKKWFEFHWFDRHGKAQRAHTLWPEKFARQLELDNIHMYVAYEMEALR